MSDLYVPRVGGILSADIAVPEHEREVSFYKSVLCTGEKPLWREDLMNNQGVPIIGLGAHSPEYADLPLQWMPHIQVADVEASRQRAMDLGGQDIMHDEAGQWAVLLDPNEAAFGLIPVVSADDIPPTDGDASQEAAGCIAWVDLTIPDAPATRDFYRQVLDVSVQDVEMKDADGGYADYNLIGGDGNPVMGVCHARGVNTDLPPVWMLYLPVGDLAESLRQVREEGGEVIKSTQGSGGEFEYAIIQDPVGVYLALVPG